MKNAEELLKNFKTDDLPYGEDKKLYDKVNKKVLESIEPDKENDTALSEAKAKEFQEVRLLRECNKPESTVEKRKFYEALSVLIGFQIGHSLIWGTVVVLVTYIIAVLRK